MMPYETQHRAPRDSVFLLAALRFENLEAEHKVRVRNLSATGLMADGDIPVSPGLIVTINLRNIGWVNGSVSWTEGKRFGIRFVNEIDPRRIRNSV